MFPFERDLLLCAGRNKAGAGKKKIKSEGGYLPVGEMS
jgi:hypothetical protein